MPASNTSESIYRIGQVSTSSRKADDLPTLSAPTITISAVAPTTFWSSHFLSQPLSSGHKTTYTSLYVKSI